LDTLDPSCGDVIDNIDDFIHAGRCKWDAIFFGPNGDSIYDIEGRFQLFPLEQPYVIATDSYVWQHEDDMVTNLFWSLRDDLLQHSHDDFWSYLRGFDTYYFEHLDLFYGEDFQPPLCSNFDEDEAMICTE
jgi:hypothetical protein